MSNRWIVLDCSFLCWRIFYTDLRKLSHNDIPTGIMYGFIRDMLDLQDQLDTKNMIFCFDSLESKRRMIYEGYKGTRREKLNNAPQEEKRAHQALFTQLMILRTGVLPGMGFKNIFHSEGFEADDLIASVTLNRPDDSELVIVSSDKDLYQLLEPDVSMWNVTKKIFYTHGMFEKEWGLPPTSWAFVKAIAGCNTDDVPGVPGVGDKTAVKFLLRKKGETSKSFDKIKSYRKQIKQTMQLVQLPFPGTPDVQIKRDRPDKEEWDRILKKYGMKSLRNSPPVLKRKGLHDEKG